MPVTTEAIKSMTDEELDRFLNAGNQEKAARAERHKQETIAKIRELAESISLPVNFGAGRGRPKSGKRLKAGAK
jgi:hypothetical protein